MIAKLQDHVIVCGSDPVAQAVVERLLRRRRNVVVVDDDQQALDRLRQRHRRLVVVSGPATDELILAEANVTNAETVVAALENELDNLLVTITCKDLGTGVRVIAHSNDATIGNRLRKASVDEIVSPVQLSSDCIANLILTEA